MSKEVKAVLRDWFMVAGCIGGIVESSETYDIGKRLRTTRIAEAKHRDGGGYVITTESGSRYELSGDPAANYSALSAMLDKFIETGKWDW